MHRKRLVCNRSLLTGALRLPAPARHAHQPPPAIATGNLGSALAYHASLHTPPHARASPNSHDEWSHNGPPSVLDRARCLGQAPGRVRYTGWQARLGGMRRHSGAIRGESEAEREECPQGCIGKGCRGNGCGIRGSGVRFGGHRTSERDGPERMRGANQSVSARDGRGRTREAESGAGRGKRASGHAVREGVLRWRDAGSGRERDDEGGAYDVVYCV